MKCAIQERINAYNMSHILPVRLGISIGALVTSPADEASDMDYYISQSDRMMYQMKKKKKEAVRSNGRWISRGEDECHGN